MFMAFLLSGLFNLTCLTNLEGVSTSKWVNPVDAKAADEDNERAAVERSKVVGRNMANKGVSRSRQRPL